MTFSTVVPNAGQSPGLFPSQNNTNFARLKTIINADHVFNDTAQADDGIHRQVTQVNRTDPVTVPAGANSILYGKTASDSVNEQWFYDGVTPRQLNWRELSGTVAVSSTFATIAAIPTNCYGEVYLFKDGFIQAGALVSDGSVVNGYSYAEKYISGSSASQILNLGFVGAGGSGLNLRVANTGSSSFDGNWTYRIFYRKYA